MSRWVFGSLMRVTHSCSCDRPATETVARVRMIPRGRRRSWRGSAAPGQSILAFFAYKWRCALGHCAVEDHLAHIELLPGIRITEVHRIGLRVVESSNEVLELLDHDSRGRRVESRGRRRVVRQRGVDVHKECALIWVVHAVHSERNARIDLKRDKVAGRVRA